MGFEKESLCAPVAGLLPEIAQHAGAPAVPDKGGRSERQLPAMVEKPPAEVDIVPGGYELGLEASDGLEGRAPEGEIAAGEVFRLQVPGEDVGGCAGGRGDDGFLYPGRCRGQVGSSGSPGLRVTEGPRDPEEVIKEIVSLHPEVVICCTLASERAITSQELAQTVQTHGVESEIASDPTEAIERALVLSSEEDLILVTGSFYLLSATRASLSFD